MTEILDPKHYRSNNGIQCIDVIEAWELNYHRGNIIKYLLRAGKKHLETEIEDLCKARWYLDREIARLQDIKSSATPAAAQPLSPAEKPRARIVAQCSKCCDQPDGFAA